MFPLKNVARKKVKSSPIKELIHGSYKPGKVMEFKACLEKSLNFMLAWKNGILPGKGIEKYHY